MSQVLANAHHQSSSSHQLLSCQDDRPVIDRSPSPKCQFFATKIDEQPTTISLVRHDHHQDSTGQTFATNSASSTPLIDDLSESDIFVSVDRNASIDLPAINEDANEEVYSSVVESLSSDDELPPQPIMCAPPKPPSPTDDKQSENVISTTTTHESIASTSDDGESSPQRPDEDDDEDEEDDDGDEKTKVTVREKSGRKQMLANRCQSEMVLGDDERRRTTTIIGGASSNLLDSKTLSTSTPSIDSLPTVPTASLSTSIVRDESHIVDDGWLLMSGRFQIFVESINSLSPSDGGCVSVGFALSFF